MGSAPADTWVESDEITERLTPSKKIELLDTSLSRIVPGVKRGSQEEFVQSGQNHLSVQLDAVNPIIDLTDEDDSFQLAFTIFNPTENDVKMLIRDTPLEGVLSNLFVVHNPEGELMEYRGKDVKRDAVPGADEYRTVKAGESISRRVRLSRRYQLEGDGLYYIRVRQPRDGHMHYTDVMRTQTTVFLKGSQQHEERDKVRQKQREERAGIVSKPNAMFDPQLTEVGASIKYSGCSSSRQTELRNWHEDARLKIDKATQCTTSSCSDSIDTWFGASTTQAQFDAGAKAQFQTMASVMDSTTFMCQGGTPSMRSTCGGGSTFAYVYPTDRTQQIYICDFTFNYPDYSEKVQTVIHELSHFNHIGGTDDNAYGESTCINLAQQDYQRAIKTADNVGYFGKYIDQCYPNGPANYKPANPPKVGCTDRYSNCGELASNCDGRTSAGTIRSVCCRSCSAPAGGSCSGGGSSGGGGSTSSRRRRTPTPPAPASRPAAADTASNCADMIANYGCDACCIRSTGGAVSSVCAASCGAPTIT